ncbi:SusD/RagB family nutrient-binding outer membrane lipoprotein [Maribacter sp. 2307ULW6-5]|uniref:SusD/RagB family nutrient-binding outer membrane lipoprotein n=1 Tax=Maribacter sp. 2307ULW6-5 TaxID=3386275 RepID=UPI0039BD5651
MTMNVLKKYFGVGILSLVFFAACEDLEELNINPNGVDPAVADANLLMPAIITRTAQNVVSLGFGNVAGVMQHTQKDGWSGGHNNYEWDVNSQSWRSYYDILRNNEVFYDKSVQADLEFQQGVGLVIKSFVFGLITDLWGDAPYSEALGADEGPEFYQPVFDDQKDIYMGILTDLEKANTLLSKTSYEGIVPSQDVLYNGDVQKWRKFANSLALRYFMRLSAKDPGTAEAGIRKITSNPGKYPVITNASNDAQVFYPGDAPANSWPSNTVFDISENGEYFRTKMCATLVETLQALEDPRLSVWANKIAIPLVLDPSAPDDTDEIVDGVRRVSQKVVDDYVMAWQTPVDFDAEYVGIPPSTFAAPSYNLNPNLEQGVFNPHASQLNDRYRQTEGPLLSSRLLSAAEVHFILAEAALYGWAPGAAEAHYNEGIRQSLNAWGVGSSYDAYISNAVFTGLEDILTQKWIASWTTAHESWFDYRRTGLPDLQTGVAAIRQAVPLRFYYHFNDEISVNTLNAEAAIEKLQPTQFKGEDISNNSAWSKMWLLQGTNLPY